MAKNESLLSKALGRFGLEFTGVQKRSSLENPQTPLSYPAEWLLDIFNGGRTDSGLRVSEMTALQTATVFQCVTIIANGIAAHPLNVYQRILEDGRIAKKISFDHKLFDILSSEPNPEMTSATWRRTMQCHKLLWGNAYSEIQRDKSGRVIAIWPRNPSRTRPVRITQGFEWEGTYWPAGTLMYETFETLGDSQIMEQDSANNGYGQRRLVLAEDIIHMPGLSLDGRIGQDVVILARQAIGLALATEKYGAKFFGNGAIPTGLLGVPANMTEVQWEVLKRSWSESHGGENTHKTGVLPPGVTYTKTGATPEEGQMLQTRQHQKAEIASVFNVPGHMIGINGDDAGKSTVEQSSIEFKLFCMDPHVTDWEQELARKLFPKTGQHANKFLAAFDMRKLMYPDAASRSAFYGSGKQWGYLTTNDIHELEGMNPVDDGSGDKSWMPNNMVDAAAASVQSDAVTKGFKDGTLAATPAGVTPIGNHPVKLDEKKALKDSQAHDLEKHKITADATVKIAKHTGRAPGNDGGDDAPKDKAKAKAKKRDDIVRVFSGVFRDAAGRAANRKKATWADYVAIFGPVISAIHEVAHDEPTDITEFVNTRTTDLFTRNAAGWGDDIDASAAVEFESLINGLLEL